MPTLEPIGVDGGLLLDETHEGIFHQYTRGTHQFQTKIPDAPNNAKTLGRAVCLIA